MQTSHPRILLRWPLLATPVALSRPSRTCVVRTSTDKIWKMQQSEGHVLSSAARGPPLVFRRREHAESATKSAPWYFLLTNKTEDSKFVAVLCHCFVTMVVWGGGLHLIDQFHYIKIFVLGLWLGEIKQRNILFIICWASRWFLLFYSPMPWCHVCILICWNCFWPCTELQITFCYLNGDKSDKKCCWTQSRTHYGSLMRILQGRHGTRKDNWLRPDIPNNNAISLVWQFTWFMSNLG